MTIQLLDKELIAKIAAGEVIERPASVVKELLENSLDAGSTEVIIRIEEGGKRLIQITDNGSGIPKDELKFAMMRHATSKINKVEDLYNLHTLGFRGEALASVDAAGQATLISRTKEQSNAFSIHKGNITPASHEIGTTIIVKDLFSGLPARKKFLKTPATESRIIHEIIQEYALCYPHVGFKFHNDGELELSVQKGQTLLERAKSIFGKDVSSSLVELVKSPPPSQGCTARGIIGIPPAMRSNRKHEIVFCNNRLITSNMVTAAIEQAYAGFIPLQHYPIACIFITIDPAMIDVNVHPAKTSIKFAEESLVFRTVFHAVQDTLKMHATIQQPEDVAVQSTLGPMQDKPIGSSGSMPIPRVTSTSQSRPTSYPKSTPYYGFSTDKQTNISVVNDATQTSHTQDDTPPFKILDIINKTYIIASFPEGLTITDFHAAYERLNYELLTKKFADHSVQSQQLLSPHIFESDALTVKKIKDITKELEEMGVMIEDFGPNTLQVTQVPVIMGRRVDPSIIEDIAETLTETQGKNPLQKKKDQIITRMSCKASPRSGDTISFDEARDLLKALYKNQLHWTCPHGRPVMVLMSIDGLGKLFHRI